MSENKENVPKLRFPGFAEAWEQRKLGDVATFINGRAYSQDELLDDGKYRVLRVGNFYTNNSWYYSNMELGEKYYANTGDLLYTWSATFGPHIWHGNKVIYHYHIWKVELSEKFDKQFAVQILEYDKAKIMSNTNGSTMIHITKKGMEEKTVSLPSIGEQKKIGQLLDTIDNLITLHQRKLNHVKNLKVGLIQKMFPKDGEEFPEVRFPGFTDAWEQRKLKDIASSTHGGGTPATTNEDYWNGTIPWIQSSDLTENEVFGVSPRKYISEAGLRNSATKLVPENSIAIITRVGVGKLALIPFSYTTSQDFLSLSGLNIDPWFGVYVCYKKLQSELHKVQGTSIKGITKDELLEKSITVPSMNEQIQIGTFFKELDNLITLHQRKLENLQNQKKALLQQMFI